jgi:ATP-dependent helicase/nuclease subunit B
VDAENQRRAEHGLTPIATELPFGMGGHEPIAVDLGNDRSLKMKGKADRIDRDENGGLVAVDYKTGRPDDYKALTEGNPTNHGSRFQLPVYALAAQQTHTGRSVRGEYWFISRRAAFVPIGYNVTQDVLDELASTADVVVSSISSGIFPARPFESGKAWQCPTCALVGDVAVDRSWKAKMHDPSLRNYLAMLSEADDD